MNWCTTITIRQSIVINLWNKTSRVFWVLLFLFLIFFEYVFNIFKRIFLLFVGISSVLFYINMYTVKPRYKVPQYYGNFGIKEVFASAENWWTNFTAEHLLFRIYILRELFLSICPLFYYNIIGPKIKKKTVLGTKIFY